MFRFIVDNIGTIAVGAAVLAVIVFAVVRTVRRSRRGTGCGCGCEGCEAGERKNLRP
ncbi:MAG: FeoB-associated Cys-rich membrane protein [Oscillospiraceae bacterium]|nr:FeoB-associated Cys-rich membrane protein [Oscillospiraceae bacterium]